MKDGSHTNTNRVRVLMDSQAFDFQTHGGISRCFAGLIGHMPEDIDITLPILETHNQYLKEMGLAPERDYYMDFCKGHPTSVNRFWYKVLTNIRHGHWRHWDRMPHYSIFEAERLLERGEFDVFHPTYFDPYFLDKIGKKPFVLTVHDMISERYAGTYRFHDGQLQGKRKLIPRAAHIIAVSEHTKQDIVDLFGISPDKISVVYHGIDQRPYVPSPEGNPNGCYILYVGGRNMYKNFLRFVQDITPVLRNHRDLSVICTGKPFSREELGVLQDSGFSDRYVQKFIESDQELMDLYHFAQVFVFPSEYEGFGIPVLEAYKAGCPVLLNRASCFPEIAGDAAVYFGFDGKDRGLRECMEELLAWTPAQRQECIAVQRQRLQLYTWEKAARELAEVYRKVAGE